MTDKIFPDGIFFSEPREDAPEWIKGGLSIKVADAIPFLEANKNGGGYVNLTLKVSKKTGKTYLELDTWRPTKKEEPAPDSNEIPF